MYAEPCDILHTSSSRERHLALEKQWRGSNRLYTVAHAVTYQACVCPQYGKICLRRYIDILNVNSRLSKNYC